MNNTQHSRQNMIQSQLLTGAILDAPVLEAMRLIPRENFVPDKLKGAAYLDEDIEVAAGRYLIEPLIFAKLLVLAGIKPSDKVLDVACGTGYASAVLSKLAARVVAIDEMRDVAEKAKQNIRNLNITNVEVVTTSLSGGQVEMGPYDVIFIEGAVQNIPEALKQQLAPGGRLVGVENIAVKAGSSCGLGKAVLYTRLGNELFRRVAFDASTPILVPFQTKADFIF